MSLFELLHDCVEESFSIDKINFDLVCYDFQQDHSLTQMKHLVGHLASKSSHRSAVGLLGSQPGYQDIGHAISMYDFCLTTQEIYYKDSSMRAYNLYQSENASPQSKGLPLRIRSGCKELQMITKDNKVLKKAWTLKAEYNGADRKTSDDKTVIQNS